MGRKTLRTLVVSGALVAGVGMVGASVASAVAPDRSPTARTEVRVNSSEATLRVAGVDGLRVRTGPGTSSPILGLVYEGQRLQVIGSGRDSGGQIWHLVMLQHESSSGLPGGYIGWVSDAYLFEAPRPYGY